MEVKEEKKDYTTIGISKDVKALLDKVQAVAKLENTNLPTYNDVVKFLAILYLGQKGVKHENE